MDERKSKELVLSPANYLAEQGRSLDSLLDKIRLPEGAKEAIVAGKSRKLIRDHMLGLFKIGEIIREALNWNENIEKEIKEAKKNVLLSRYFEAAEDNAHAVSHLKSLITSAQGNTLFNKIIRILDNNPPDDLLTKHLSNALRHITDSDFISLFEEHRYALSQIEQISPQALAILADRTSWPNIRLGSYTSNGLKVTSDWLMEFTTAYTEAKHINDPGMRHRVQHSISELINHRMIEALMAQAGVARCSVTEIGGLILPYISG